LPLLFIRRKERATIERLDAYIPQNANRISAWLLGRRVLPVGSPSNVELFYSSTTALPSAIAPEKIVLVKPSFHNLFFPFGQQTFAVQGFAVFGFTGG
jgi:hypothetical protein